MRGREGGGEEETIVSTHSNKHAEKRLHLRAKSLRHTCGACHRQSLLAGQMLARRMHACHTEY